MMADDHISARKAGSDAEKGSPTSQMANLEDRRSANMSGKINSYIRSLIVQNFEARGIDRVRPTERHAQSYRSIFTLWFSINLAANNITLGMLGPSVFHLSFLDSCLCSVFGMLLGCLLVAYIATFGPRSGNRSLVIARYAMGWWPVKIIVVLNIVNLVGYSMIDAVVAGQILSAVSSPPGSMSVVVGIIIVAVVTWAITTFGYTSLHAYMKYAWLPSIIVFSILAGVSGPSFDLSGPTEGDAWTRVGSRLSYLSICFSAAATYAPEGADYFVYYPVETPRWKIFFTVLASLALSFTYAFVIGIGLASGASTNQAWASALDTSQGALIVAGFAPLGTFGNFCAVLVALGLIANMIPPTYSAGVDFQILGRWFARVPRVAWNTFAVVVYTVCAAAGREHLAEIFTNFLALMGYWVSIWLAITFEEHLIFKRYFTGLYTTDRSSPSSSENDALDQKLNGDTSDGFDWTAWNSPDKLPVGIAAFISFLVGWAGAIISMAQVWYIGPLASLVGEDGADMGNYVAFSWTLLVFLPLRYIELKYFKR